MILVGADVQSVQGTNQQFDTIRYETSRKKPHCNGVHTICTGLKFLYFVGLHSAVQSIIAVDTPGPKCSFRSFHVPPLFIDVVLAFSNDMVGRLYI